MFNQWQQSTLNGGGFIEGILQNPQHPTIMYARSDVAGVFKSVDRGRSWVAKNHGMTDCHQHDIQSFAISPHNPNILFRCSGSVRGKTFFGTIHKTRNGGDDWYPVCDEATFFGNGETRQCGDAIQVSPHDPNLVIAGAYTNGIWLSTDEGETWQNKGLDGERLCALAFHPTDDNIVYIGTIGSFDKNPKFVEQQYDFVRPNPARLYRSSDKGETWDVLHEGLDFSEIVFDITNPNIMHAACMGDGIFKSTDGGQNWVNNAPNLSKYEFVTLAINSKNINHLVTAALTYPNFDADVPPIGVYQSLDAGDSWELIRWHQTDDIHNYPSYMTLEWAGWCIAKIHIDVEDSNTLYISNWYGVSISHDGGLTWDANHFKGMENICIENMTAHPTDANTLFMVTADHNPKVSRDAGDTFEGMYRIELENTQPDSTAIVASRFRPDFVLYGVKGLSGCTLLRSTAYDEPPEIVLSLTAELDTDPGELDFQSRAAGVSVQALVEDPHREGHFYAYIDGILEYGAGLYRTQNWGDTWQILASPFPDYIKRVPYQREWIENELLSVVIAQTKNVCGTNQLLAIDPHQSDTIYLGEWTEGLFRSRDGGENWENIGYLLPFQINRASVLNVIRTDPNQAGLIYAGFIREGLWRSENYGDTWQKIYPLDDRIYNATSIAIGGSNNDLLVVVSEPLFYANSPSTVMLSRDKGKTWGNIYDPQLGAIRWKTVLISTGTNRIHAGSCGNSAFYYDLGLDHDPNIQ
ncbi:MAG: hypothetical protein WBC91_04920 [Phototrophicaceae bacterium]